MKSRLHRWLPSALPFLLAACASTNEPAGPPLLPPPPVVASAPAAPRAAQAPSPTASRASEAQLTVAQRREIFEAAWSRLAELHFDPALGGVDWKAVHEKTAPKVDGCKDDDALLEVLNDMCAALGHSHVAVMPPEGAEERDIEKSLAALPATEDREEKRASAEAELFGDTGIRASAIEDGIVVVSVAAGSPAEKAGIRVGDAIEAIGDLSSQRLLSLAKGHHVDPTGRGVIPYVVQARLTGNVGTRAKLTVSRAGEKRELEVERVAPDVPPVRFGTLGAMHADFEKRTLPGGVLYVRFSP
ncbi:MAG TPA: PDZ domain-containing protein, partial [Planctomycetota bacterium]|nr:PDZ domain-containing protein [Planctomycetota bacterium]